MLLASPAVVEDTPASGAGPIQRLRDVGRVNLVIWQRLPTLQFRPAAPRCDQKCPWAYAALSRDMSNPLTLLIRPTSSSVGQIDFGPRMNDQHDRRSHRSYSSPALVFWIGVPVRHGHRVIEFTRHSRETEPVLLAASCNSSLDPMSTDPVQPCVATLLLVTIGAGSNPGGRLGIKGRSPSATRSETPHPRPASDASVTTRQAGTPCERQPRLGR